MGILLILFGQLLLIAIVTIVLYQLKSRITLAPLYIFIGSNQYSQHFLSNTLTFEGYSVATGSIVVFCSSLFAVLLIYIKEGVPKTRTLILGVVIVNFTLTAFAGLTKLGTTYFAAVSSSNQLIESALNINYPLFLFGTILLLIDSFLVVIVYEFFVTRTKFMKRFGGIMVALISVLYFDSIAFSFGLSRLRSSYTTILIGQVVAKTVAGGFYGIILYGFIKFSEQPSKRFFRRTSTDSRDIFSILTYREKYRGISDTVSSFENQLTSQLVNTLETMSDNFVSFNKKWQYTYVNKPACEFFGMDADHLIGKNIWKLFPHLVATSFYENCHLAAGSGREVDVVDHDEFSEKWFHLRFIPSGTGLSIFFRDITDTRTAEERITKAQQRNEALLKSLPDLMFVIDREGKFIDFHNPHGKETIADPADYLGASVFEILQPELAKKTVELISRTIETGEIIEHNYELEFPGGTKFFESRYIKNSDDDVISVVRDITEEIQVENALKESESKYRSLIEQASDGILVYDFEGNMLEFNAATVKYSGYTREEFAKKTIMDLLFVDDLIDLPIPYDRLKNGETTSSTRRIKRKDGSAIMMDISSRMNDKGNIIAITRDISDRLAVEREVIEGEKRFKTLTENLPIGVFQTDIHGKCVYVNDFWRRITGLTFEESMGEGWISGIHPDDRTRMIREWGNAFENSRDFMYECRSINRNGKITQIQGLAIGITDSNGKIYAYIGTHVDVTEQRKTDAELALYRENLEELVEARTAELEIEKVKAQSADKLKSAFLATMSHELRTPLNSIIGFTGILLNEFAGPLNEEQSKQLSMVKNSGKHLLSLINDILDLSKIEAGELSFSASSFDYSRSIRKVIEIVRPLADAKGLMLELIDPLEKIDLVNDERRIEQVLINLLDNAVKFTDSGTVQIDWHVRNNILITKITDTGIGIRKEDLTKLFIPFSQIETGISRNHQGTGLGLSISKKLVKLLGGNIAVESELGTGSTFIVTFPLTKI